MAVISARHRNDKIRVARRFHCSYTLTIIVITGHLLLIGFYICLFLEEETEILLSNIVLECLRHHLDAISHSRLLTAFAASSHPTLFVPCAYLCIILTTPPPYAHKMHTPPPLSTFVF